MNEIPLYQSASQLNFQAAICFLSLRFCFHSIIIAFMPKHLTYIEDNIVHKVKLAKFFVRTCSLLPEPVRSREFIYINGNLLMLPREEYIIPVVG